MDEGANVGKGREIEPPAGFQHPDGDYGHDPEHAAMSSELQGRVREAIRGLPNKLPLAVVLRDVHGLS